MSERSQDSIAEVAAILRKRYEPHVAALMAYGSRVCGHARTGSAYDFWLIIRDLESFHRSNAEFYRTQLNVPSTPDEQIRLNREGPLFYALREDARDIKLAVIDEAGLIELCLHDWWTIKGRMQKPLRLFVTTPLVERAILAARCDGLVSALNLTPPSFTLDELLKEIVGLSYRAEVRPEHKEAKITSILETGRSELERIYSPLLAELPYVERCGDSWLDRRPAAARAEARAATLRSLRRSKWSSRSLEFVWRNYCSHRKPLRYILMKILGEIEKALRRF